jgi:hypothetical protein
LCNIIFKYITKILANRLSFLLPKIISFTHGAYVNGRSIHDNIVLAHELIQNIDYDF